MKIRPWTATWSAVGVSVLLGATLAADFFWRSAIGPVSYTHLTLPTKA